MSRLLGSTVTLTLVIHLLALPSFGLEYEVIDDPLFGHHNPSPCPGGYARTVSLFTELELEGDPLIIPFGTVEIEQDETDLWFDLVGTAGTAIGSFSIYLGDPAEAPRTSDGALSPEEFTIFYPDVLSLAPLVRIPLSELNERNQVMVYALQQFFDVQGEIVEQYDTWAGGVPPAPESELVVTFSLCDGQLEAPWQTGPQLDCTYSHGFWKNHPESWPVDTLELGTEPLGQPELLELLDAPPRGDATYQLAHQLIAAELNASQGADTTAVDDALSSAHEWLEIHPLGSRPGKPDRDTGRDLANQLDAFNNGLIGPGHCDD